MKIDVQDLLTGKSESKIVSEDFNLKTLDFNNNEYSFEGPIHIEGTLNKNEDGIFFKGNIFAKVKTVCSRCLDEVVKDLNIDFEEEFNKSQDELGYTINDNKIDITKLIEDNIFLNVPLKTLCSESCKGLCPVCGTNLNKSTCSCDTQIIDPRLEKLKNFFNRD
ncbi:YceD family protein [Caloramator proteoclasticus]|uniref:DUF177 domain-containing protein n=1 Tax=Caloramator proteoclasticus DSM 10124 TaxID=1121262 RepID=A0A1M5B154_9CLOT|nr:DUF177 domain-containing protein [Caloramator proteoclasticus]SHF36208.1 uncharacterized protein SAMN02746091_02347 [Caloramator proteoclasticus DSM 10124]